MDKRFPNTTKGRETNRSKPKSKRKAMPRVRLNWLVDIALLLCFVPLFLEDETGRDIHQILGLIFGAGIIWHVALHWKWVLGITKRLFKRQPRNTRINYIINWLMLVSLIATTLTGLPIASWFRGMDVPIFDSRLHYEWLGIHDTFSYILLGLVVIHLLLHRKWIVKTTKRYLKLPKPLAAAIAYFRLKLGEKQLRQRKQIG